MARSRRQRQSNANKVEALTYGSEARRNIPTAEQAPFVPDGMREPVTVAYARRNRDLDPQLMWRGKDEIDTPREGDDEAYLLAQAPPLYTEEKISPKVLVDDLMRYSVGLARDAVEADPDGSYQTDLFSDFNGLPSEAARTEFYQHDMNWSNRMILGDSLQVMASLAEREGLRGKVQCIYIDPPYGIRFNSNFQWSTTSRDVRDGNLDHMTRQPEQVKAFRDTWRNGIHSYLSYLRDRLTAARDLLADSGSCFVQIGDENIHRVRAVMDEVFGDENFVSLITYRTSSGTTQQNSIKRISDYIIWYCKDSADMKFRRLLESKEIDTNMYNQLELEDGTRRPMTATERKDPTLCPIRSRPFQKLPVHSMASGDHEPRILFETVWRIPPNSKWRVAPDGFERLYKASRIHPDQTALRAVYYHDDYPAFEITNSWDDTGPEVVKQFVVQTSVTPIKRCILMTTDPGDLVIDPTCGSGTTAYVAEQWGRRWITVDTSRVALTLARARMMGARYPWYILVDSSEGQAKEGEVAGRVPSTTPTYGDIRQGFVYERVPHITLRDIANNGEIDTIWETYQVRLNPLLAAIKSLLGADLNEWEIPRNADEAWPDEAKRLHGEWWEARIARQKEIDASIARNAGQELLYDKPYVDRQRVRMAGPFTIDSLSPHRIPLVDDDTPADNGRTLRETGPGVRYQGSAPKRDFAQEMLAELERAGVQQAHKEDRITFTSITGWPGKYICGEGRFLEGETEEGATERRTAIFVGPEYGTVSRQDLVAAAREAAECGFDLLVACAFAYDAHTTELDKLGSLQVLKARMNADLHMSADLKPTDKANLFTVFGEPDIEIEKTDDGLYRVRILGVDVFDPRTGEIRSDGRDGIACWFIDTAYNEESFFVRHAYFLGADDHYKSHYESLKTTLRAEINQEAWDSLHSDVSRPFPRPDSGRIAVKVINHLGDEVMKVLSVQ